MLPQKSRMRKTHEVIEHPSPAVHERERKQMGESGETYRVMCSYSGVEASTIFVTMAHV